MGSNRWLDGRACASRAAHADARVRIRRVCVRACVYARVRVPDVCTQCIDLIDLIDLI